MTALLTVDYLAASKGLPAAFLLGLGICDAPDGSVAMPYYAEDGEEMFVRTRHAEGARFRQPAGVNLVAYGLNKLDLARRAGYLVLVEGESDCWALWSRGLPALGIPGSNSARVILRDFLEGIERVYIHREPDRGGECFLNGCRKRLAALRYPGRVYELTMPDRVKDPSELLAGDPEHFLERWQECVRNADALPLRIEAADKQANNGHVKGEEKAVIFPPPIPSSQLRTAEGRSWLWHGYLAPGSVTLLSALWKSGKTTLLAHLLRAMERGGEFCGRSLVSGKILVVTEESEHRWAKRRDKLGLADHASFIVRPFHGKPSWKEWESFISYLMSVIKRDPVQLVILDPLVNLWPVRDENDNAQVLSALLPLHGITETSAALLSHHNRKGDGQEGTAPRGAGAFMGFVDTIIEMRRYLASDPKDHRRVLTGYGRDEETPEELVVELTSDGYVPHGDRGEATDMETLPRILLVLPQGPPGWTCEETHENWPDEWPRPHIRRLMQCLKKGAAAGQWQQSGEGKSGSPWRFFQSPVSCIPLI